MRAGKMPHRIKIQADTPTRDVLGAETSAWATIAGGNCWARIEPLSGQERWVAQQVNAESTLKVTMRYDSALTEQHRILFGSRVLQINAISNTDEMNKELVVMCSEEK